MGSIQYLYTHYPMLNPKLQSLHSSIKPKTPRPKLKLSNLSAAAHEYLVELGGVFVDTCLDPDQIQHCLLEIGKVGDVYYWIDFGDAHSLGLDWKFLACKLIEPEEFHQFSIVGRIASRFKVGNSRLVTIDHGRLSKPDLDPENKGNLQCLIKTCLRFFANDRHCFELSLLANRRIEAKLTYLNYSVAWPEEIVYDLERVRVADGSTYYIDSSDQIHQTAWGICFNDLHGAEVTLSPTCSFVVDPLTFLNVTELAAERKTLVVPQVEMLRGFFQHRLHGTDELVPIHVEDAKIEDPLLVDGYLAYTFFTPIPAIADKLKPIVEAGGLSI
jgi:hypothetical protein